jgi:acetyl esterase/lipase
MDVVNLVVAVIFFLAALTALIPLRPDPLSGFSFAAGFVLTDLAGQVLVIEGFVAWLLWLFGGNHHAIGQVAWWLELAAMAMFLLVYLVGLDTRRVVKRALAQTSTGPIRLSAEQRRGAWHRWWRSIRAIPFRGTGVEVTKNLRYSDDAAGVHLLDLYRSAATKEGAPVMVFIHGGAWVIGDKREQGRPMMFELASRGWLCVSVNYQLSPKATWPEHIIDVNRALLWVKQHIAEYGGDPSRVAISGGSAGGQLCALAALAHDDPAYKPGFEDADLSTIACVTLYGVHDMTADRSLSGRHGSGLKILLERKVMKVAISQDRQRFIDASPLYRVRSDAPPFLIFQGTNDTLVPPSVGRAFASALRGVSKAPVTYVEFPLAQHAFDVYCSPRCTATVQGIVAFLDSVLARRSQGL